MWRTVRRLPYPYRQVYELLTLPGLRLNAAADASWSEFNPAVVRALRQPKEEDERVDWWRFTVEQFVWIIPAERMKGDNVDAKPHLVPLTPDILRALEMLPLFRNGDYLFSTTFAERPVWMSHKIKKHIDGRMLRTLRALARQRGDDPARVELEHWVNHDLRRVVRSNLSRLRVTEEVREAVLAHVRPGIKGNYDVYDYADEKREALELWAARLRSIVEPRTRPTENAGQQTVVAESCYRCVRA
jgi:integrase